jgi:hypothetical protein
VRVRTLKDVHDSLEAALIFEVTHGAMRGRPVSRHCSYGSIFIPHRWVTTSSQNSSPVEGAAYL